MSRDCAITLLHENVTRYCIVGARIECAKIVVFVLIRAKVIIIVFIVPCCIINSVSILKMYANLALVYN